MLEQTTWSSMQDSPGAENKRQKALERLAAKSHNEGSITPEEAAYILGVEEPERLWDPLAVAGSKGVFDEDEVQERILNPGTGIGSYAAYLKKTKKPAPTPEEAIAELFAKMKPYKSFLIHILEACQEKATAETIDAAVWPDYEFCACVYTPITLRKMLVDAQALTYIVATGENAATETDAALTGSEGVADTCNALAGEVPFTVADDAATDRDIDEIGAPYIPEALVEDAAPKEPIVSIYDRPNFLVIEDEGEGSWLITEAGQSYLAAVNPEKEFHTMLDKHCDINDLFFDVLAFCDTEPRNIIDIVRRFENDPRLSTRNIYASYLVDRLEELGALVWKKNWVTTDLGKSLLNERV